MPKLVCSLAAGLMLVNSTATAHSWYPNECCSDNDCHPVPCAELVLTPEGDVKWKGVLYFSHRMVRLSLDERCHDCVEEGSSASVIPYLPLCVCVPHATSCAPKAYREPLARPPPRPRRGATIQTVFGRRDRGSHHR